MILSISDYNHKKAFLWAKLADQIVNKIANSVTQQSQEAAYIAVPSDGLVTVDDNEMMIGSIANYTCDTGFLLQGKSSRVCQANGTWSSNPPSCQDTILG